jgi:hypothetical protein
MTARAEHWAVWLTLLLCVLAFVLGVVFMPGPSDTEAAADTAADLQEAPQQARAEVHQAQALAMLAASGHK